MACCAFAVFVLGQIYMAFEAVARALGIAPMESDRPTATDWRLGAPVPAIALPASRLRLPAFSKRMVLAGGISAVALTTAVPFRPHAAEFDMAAYLADPAHICGSALASS